jgi:hypothetical protein
MVGWLDGVGWLFTWLDGWMVGWRWMVVHIVEHPAHNKGVLPTANDYLTNQRSDGLEIRLGKRVYYGKGLSRKRA